MPLDLRWEVRDLNGEAVAVAAPGDWARQSGYELFSGTLRYRTELTLPAPATEVWLDLGQGGGQRGRFPLDGQPVGVRMWAPYPRVLGPRPGAGDAPLGSALSPTAWRTSMRAASGRPV